VSPQFEYDRIGTGYGARRTEDPRLEAGIRAALGDATTVLNVGAGTGSYEPNDRLVVAVEPSAVMIAQRRPDRAPAVRGVAEALPFPALAFDAVMAILTVHHWSNARAGLAEMRRVAARQVVLTFDAAVHSRTWLMDYVPELAQVQSSRGVSVQEVMDSVGASSAIPIPVPHDCQDGMMVAYWRRPEAYLDHKSHSGASALNQVDRGALARGLGQLERDLGSGEWARRYGHLLELDSFDCGLRLVVSAD
jgi:hypothetical protein